MIKSKWNIKYLNSSLDNRFLMHQIFITNNKLYIKRKHIKTDILIFQFVIFTSYFKINIVELNAQVQMLFI